MNRNWSVHHVYTGNASNSRNDGPIGYRRRGTGSPVILLRGLGRWSEHWCGFDDLLAESFEVITIDMRGFGLSADAILRPTHRIETFATDVMAVMRHAKISKASVVGVSLGGMIALAFASAHPDRVASLTVINSSFRNSKTSRLSAGAMRFFAGAAFRSVATRYQKLSQLLLSSACSDTERKRFATSWLRIDSGRPNLWSNLFCQLIAAARFALPEISEKIRRRTLIIVADKDRFVDPANSQLLHEMLPKSRIINHRTASHEISFEFGPWLIEQLVNHTGTLE